jgi:hypothetical protein
LGIKMVKLEANHSWLSESLAFLSIFVLKIRTSLINVRSREDIAFLCEIRPLAVTNMSRPLAELISIVIKGLLATFWVKIKSTIEFKFWIVEIYKKNIWGWNLLFRVIAKKSSRDLIFATFIAFMLVTFNFI